MKRTRLKKQNAFTLIEMVVAFFIATLVVLVTFSIFNRAHQGAVSQDRIAYMNITLNSAANFVKNGITQAGFGFRFNPDYAIRTMNNVGNEKPGQPGFSADYNIRLVTGAFSNDAKALADSDALFTIRSEEDCELLTISREETSAIGGWPGNENEEFNLIACLPQNRCRLAKNPNNESEMAPLGEIDDFDPVNGIARVLLLIDPINNNQINNLALRINDDAEVFNDGPCGGGRYLKINAVGGGLQVGGKEPPPAFPLPPLNDIIARVVKSHFYYLDDKNRLYDIPLTYFAGGEAQSDRIISENVDSFQLQYYVYNDLNFINPRHGGLDNADGGLLDDDDNDDDDIAQTEAIRFVEVDIRVRSEKPDADYENQGFAQAVFDLPEAAQTDSYRRRSLRQQILARNLHFFHNLEDSDLYP